MSMGSVIANKINKFLEVLSQLLLCRKHRFAVQQILLSVSPSPRSGSLRRLFTRQIPFQGGRKGLRPMLCKSKLLPPFISITSHQNSSPTEVATVPLAIKIMLGHVMLVCNSTVRNKSSGGSHSCGNDADSWVVNLEQCRQKLPLIPHKTETPNRPQDAALSYPSSLTLFVH